MSEEQIGLELTESKTLRTRYKDRTDALDKVKGLATLPGNQLATVKQVAEFYEVPEKTIASVVVNNRDELESNGYSTLTGTQLNSLKEFSHVGQRARSLAVLTRSAVLNVGMLLTESEVARQVRAYLLTVEATATTAHKKAAVELVRLQERMDYKVIRHALKAGGAESGEAYRRVQDALYSVLFGKTASVIRATQPQVQGDRYKTGARKGQIRPSTVAKDYLTEDQLKLLNRAVLAVFTKIGDAEDGVMVGDMLRAIHQAAEFISAPYLGKSTDLFQVQL
jgi:hypothetical protein